MLESYSFWEFVKGMFASLSSAWVWLNTPLSQLLDFMPDWYQGFLETYLPNVAGMTPLFFISVSGITLVLILRVIHLLNPIN